MEKEEWELTNDSACFTFGFLFSFCLLLNRRTIWSENPLAGQVYDSGFRTAHGQGCQVEHRRGQCRPCQTLFRPRIKNKWMADLGCVALFYTCKPHDSWITSLLSSLNSWSPGSTLIPTEHRASNNDPNMTPPSSPRPLLWMTTTSISISPHTSEVYRRKTSSRSAN